MGGQEKPGGQSNHPENRENQQGILDSVAARVASGSSIEASGVTKAALKNEPKASGMKADQNVAEKAARKEIRRPDKATWKNRTAGKIEKT